MYSSVDRNAVQVGETCYAKVMQGSGNPRILSVDPLLPLGYDQSTNLNRVIAVFTVQVAKVSNLSTNELLGRYTVGSRQNPSCRNLSVTPLNVISWTP